MPADKSQPQPRPLPVESDCEVGEVAPARAPRARAGAAALLAAAAALVLLAVTGRMGPSTGSATLASPEAVILATRRVSRPGTCAETGDYCGWSRCCSEPGARCYGKLGSGYEWCNQTCDPYIQYSVKDNAWIKTSVPDERLDCEDITMPKVIRVSESLAGFPHLCDRGIVRETCALFSSSTPEYWDTAADADASALHAAEVSYGLQVARDSVVGWMQSIGVTNVETDPDALAGGAFAADCQQLCERTVASFADSMLPEVSDVACYTDPKTGKATCDSDVSPEALSQMSEDTKDMEPVKMNQTEMQVNTSDNSTRSFDALAELNSTNLPTKSDAYMRMMVAQWFRIHPLSSVTANMTSTAVRARRLSTNDDSCKWANDGECDNYNGWCTHGTDCTDCDDCHKNVDTCTWANDGECDGEELCDPGTDCTDCQNCDGGEAVVDSSSGSSQAPVVAASIQKIATAQAWAANAVRKIGNNQRSDLLVTWFGSSSSGVRSWAKQTANSVIEVLQSCEVRSDEHECSKSPGVYAYVYRGMKNSQGQFVIYMCPPSLQYSHLAGILYHEAAHHPYANLGDVIYGRSSCKNLARTNPNGALANSDSHEYYVTDLNSR